jgi:hypothetical protein
MGYSSSEFRMPGVKVLKGVAHNIGSSFTSLMNYASDDYYMGHILRYARETGIDTLTIDLLTGLGNPESLLKEPISGLPNWYSQMFLRLVESAGSDRKLVQSATLKLVYDLNRNRPSPIPGEPQTAFACDVSIVDTRGKDYAAHFDGWWACQRYIPAKHRSIRRWWKPLTWLR